MIKASLTAGKLQGLGLKWSWTPCKSWIRTCTMMIRIVKSWTHLEVSLLTFKRSPRTTNLRQLMLEEMVWVKPGMGFITPNIIVRQSKVRWKSNKCKNGLLRHIKERTSYLRNHWILPRDHRVCMGRDPKEVMLKRSMTKTIVVCGHLTLENSTSALCNHPRINSSNKDHSQELTTISRISWKMHHLPREPTFWDGLVKRK